MRLVVGLLMTWLVVVTQSAKAGDCVPAGPPPKLDNESVYWSIVIASGQTCLRGLRSGTMIIESVAISAPAKSGQATVQGYGFSYGAPRDFKGEDSFSVTVIGTNRGIRGNSNILVHVSVQ
jgi:hypothetical protein